MNTGSRKQSRSRTGLWLRMPADMARHATGIVASVSVALLQVLPAYGQVIADGATATTVTAAGPGVTNVTTTTIHNGTAFNSFAQFSINAGDTVNLVEPGAASALVNVVRGGTQSNIAGQLNLLKGSASGPVGGNVFFVNPDGFIVSATGVINAGHLTLSTGTSSFADDLITQGTGGIVVGLDSPTALLFAGQEPLSGSNIDIYGEINARRLDLRAGARMLLDGRITVSDMGTTGTIEPAVNSEGIPTAAGATVEGGVIRLFAEGDTSIGGTISSKRGGGSGGLIESTSEGNLTLKSNLGVDVAGTGAGDSGAIVLFTKGTALLETGVRIDARAAAGDGGFFSVQAKGNATFAGVIDTGAASGTAGQVVLRGDAVTVSAPLTTGGGDLAIIGETSVTVSGTGISTRAVAVAAGGDGFNDAATGASGDLVLVAPSIDIQTGSSLRADNAGAGNGGLVALLARDRTDEIVWAIGTPETVAEINITDATLSGGTIVVTAFAQSGNKLGAVDPAEEEVQIDAADAQAETNKQRISDALDQGRVMFDQALNRGLTTVNALLPLQVQVMKAEAKIVISNSIVTADGNWKSAGLTPTTPDATLVISDNGQLSNAGLLQDEYLFFQSKPARVKTLLPTKFNSSADSIYIQSHAQTDVEIAPKSFGLGVAVAVTDTVSRVAISGSTLSTASGNAVLASTLSENMLIAIGSAGIAGVATGVVVSSRVLTNQMLVKGGSLASGGGISAMAISGKTHSISNVANAGKDGKAAIAVSVSVGSGLTEAALGGAITAAGPVSLDAETLYFGKNHTGGATMGVSSPISVFIKKQPMAVKAQGYAQSIKTKITGKDPSDPEESKPGFGFGLTVDVQLDDDDTFATLGGQYHDLDAGRALTALGATSVTAPAGAVDVNATLRFARINEGGSGLTRNISASMGKINLLIKAQVAALNAANPATPITEEELVGQFGNAIFMSAAVSSMLGETVAEIGADATINAGSLNVNALTRYPNSDPIGQIKTSWSEFTDAVSNYNPLTALPGNPAEDTPPPAPDLLTLLNPLSYLTTQTKAAAKTPSAAATPTQPGDPEPPKAEDQKLAIGVTVNVFNTENTTRAVIRDGADITLSGNLAVNARIEALFLHAANLPMSNPFGAKINDAIGAGVNVVRAKTITEATIESGASVDVADLDVDAYTRIIQASLSYSGGSAKGAAFNAGVGANVMEAQTRARIGDDVTINANAITISALDQSVNWGLSGGIAGSENTGIGVSIAVNFASRDIYAGIGPGVGNVPAATGGAVRITANSLNITATNAALDVAAAVAGAKVSGSTAEETPPADEDNDSTTTLPSHLLSGSENSSANAQSSTDTPETSAGEKQKKGWAVAGAAAMNLILSNSTTAEIVSNARINLSGNLDVVATNTNTAVTVGGAVSAGLSKTQDTNALAGAFSIHVDKRDVTARISGAEIHAVAVNVSASDAATVVNVAVGGAGTSRGAVTVAGSVAVAVLEGDVVTDIEAADITADTINLSSDNSSLTVGVGGAVAINMDKSQGYGAGVGVAVNTVNRDALTNVRAGSSLTTGSLSASAGSSAGIYGFGISVGVGKTGVSGSVAVNTISGGAKALIAGTVTQRVTIKATGISITATENNQIWSLAGALAGGQKAAIGGAITANVITANTEAALDYADVSEKSAGQPLGNVIVNADASGKIGTMAIAGGASTTGTGIGVGLTGNNITASVRASVENSTIVQAGSLAATATGSREILSLGGGVAGAGRGAAGFAATLNMLLGNDTVVSLDGSTISTRSGAITATATASGTIGTIAAAISASKQTAIGGAATTNITTATTQVTANGATLTSATGVVFSAADSGAINSLSGAASGSAQNAVGAAISVNVIDHDTAILADGAVIVAQGGAIDLSASNSAAIRTIAVGLGASGNNAISGSAAIGAINNTTRVAVSDSRLDAGTAAIGLAANKTTTISILAGAAAGSGANAFGAAVTVATIQGGVMADLATNRQITAGAMNVTATNTSSIDAIAAAGAGGGSNAGAGSVVYTQIGRPAADGPSVAPLPGGESADPVQDAQDDAAASRDQAVANANSAMARSDIALSLDTDDITRARVALGNATTQLSDLTITATETSTTRSLAGAVAGGGTAGFGAGILVNLMFGKTEAELVLPAAIVTPSGNPAVPDTIQRTQSGTVALRAEQNGTVETLAAAGAGGGTVGGAGSIVVNVMNRQASARIAGNGAHAGLQTGGGNVTVETVQNGTINSLAGAAGGGGTAGFGGAVVVNIMSDDAYALVEDAVLETGVSGAPAGAPLAGAGTVVISSTQTITQNAIAVAAAVGGTGAFGGSFAVNVAEGHVESILRRSGISASAASVTADATTNISGNAGALAGGGTAAVGLGIVVNTARMTVRSDVDGSRVRGDGTVRLTANADTTLGGIAIAGAASGTVSVTGSAIGNSSENTVEARVRNTGTPTGFGGSDVVTRGSVVMAATGSNSISMLGGADDKPGLNLSFAAGGVAGVGASATVNTSKNRILTAVEDQSRLVGLGHSSANAGRLGHITGVALDAYWATDITMVTANGAVGGVAGVAGLFSFNQIDDSTKVRVGAGSRDKSGSLNASVEDDLIAEIGTNTAAISQDIVLSSKLENSVETYALNVAVGVYAGVGAAAGTTLVTSTAETEVNVGQVGARRNITIDATANTKIDSYVAGVAGGFAGVSASANVNKIASKALVTLLGAEIIAGLEGDATQSNLNMATTIDNDATTFVGGVAGGVVGAAGAVQVNLFDSTSKILIGKADIPLFEGDVGNSSIAASGAITAAADTTLVTDTFAASGAGGAFAGALSLNINLVTATTAVDIAANQSLSAAGNLGLTANDSITLGGKAGSAAAGAISFGASMDYARLAGNTRVSVGDSARLTSGGNVNIVAESARRLDSNVVVGAVGATVGAAVAISVIEMGAEAQDSEGDRNGMLADAQTELASDQTTGGSSGSKSSAESLAGFAGGGTTRSDVVTARQSISVTGPVAPDTVSVSFGSGAYLGATGNITLNAAARNAATQLGGAGSAGGLAGISSGTVVANVATGAGIDLGSNVSLLGDGAISLSASTGGTGGDDVINARSATVSASAGYTAGVGVVSARLSGSAGIRLGDGAAIGGLNGRFASGVTMQAQRTDRISAESYNFALAGGAVGVAVVDIANTGGSTISIGQSAAGTRSSITANAISLTTGDKTALDSATTSSTGGIIAGNGSVSTASNSGTGTLSVQNATIEGGSIALSNLGSAKTSAIANGVSAGGLAVGTSVATATTGTRLATRISGSLIGSSISINTRFDNAQGTNSYARATSSAGGLIAGNGATATANLDYGLSTIINGDMSASGVILVSTNAARAKADALANGHLGGLVAIGMTFARAGQLDGRQATVSTLFDAGTITGSSVRLDAANAPDVTARSVSGSGGLVSGSGSQTRVTTNTVTLTDIGAVGPVSITANSLNIGASQTATLAGSVNTISAGLVGASGADMRTSATSKVDTILRGNTGIDAFSIDVVAANSVIRPKDGFNVVSGSGGALDIAAMISRVNVDARTNLAVMSGARLTQMESAVAPGAFRLGVVTNMDLTDRLKLDSGGAIAIPVGDSKVIVGRNDAIVTIGAADLAAQGTLTIYSGGNANLHSEVNTKSYGLAGAASSLTEATYNSNQRINLQSGARLESLGDIELMAGHTATAVQSVTVQAESRVFNKTAFPIVTNPTADATANTNSILDIGVGANVLAVQDVRLFAEGGARDITGYGRGKDLYREVLAAIGSFFSNLVGGDDVSLDIETGLSVDNANNGVLVNGYVRAGARNQQVLILDTANQLDNSLDGKSNDLAEGIEFDILHNVSVANELQKRYDTLQGYIDDPLLNVDAAAVAAWQAEQSQLVPRIAAAGSNRADVVVVKDIRAVEGNIVVRADYVQGTGSGTLEAPGNALIQIQTYSGAFLQTNKLTIPENEGGMITFNDVSVSTTAEVRALSGAKPGAYGFTMISGANSDDPAIRVATFSPTATSPQGTITVSGDVSNFRGSVEMVSNYGDLDVRGDITAKTIDLKVPNGDFILGYKPGVTNVSGSPQAQYASFFATVENKFRNQARAGRTVVGRSGQLANYGGTVQTLHLVPVTTSIQAGKNVYISADTLNINGNIIAGRGFYDVTIGSGIDAELAQLRATSAKTTGRALIFDPATPVTAGVVRSPSINSDVAVFYNFETNQIEINPMIVQGGTVQLLGNIISTGSGHIESLDGFGRINVSSDAATTVVLKRIDLGTSSAGAGINGTVRITDTAKLLSAGTVDERFLITEYRRNGGTLEVWTNDTFSVVTDPDTGIDRVRLDTLASTSTANDGRSASYSPTLNRDLIVVRGETSILKQHFLQKQLIVIGIKGSKTTTYSAKPVRTIRDAQTAKSEGPYIGASLGGADYAYAFNARRTSRSVSNTAKKKTHDSVKWWKLGSGWRHWEWDRTTTTRQLYQHRLKADYPVSIAFSGANSGGLDIRTSGNVIFSDTVTNPVGTTNIVATNGSVLTSRLGVQLVTAATTLHAQGGRIGGIEGAFRMDQIAGAAVFAQARDGIDLREMKGNMIIGQAETTRHSAVSGVAVVGNVKLQAQESLLAENASSKIAGTSIDLRAYDGDIGTTAADLAIDTIGGTLTARARGGVRISERTGDLGVFTVVSDLASVRLSAPDGSILDRNNNETRDIRTESQLVSLWTDDLDLNGGGLAGVQQEQIAALKNVRNSSYRSYWQKRDAAGGTAQNFDLPAATRTSLSNGGWTEDQLNAYVAQNQALYSQWNSEAAFDPGFDYMPTAAETATILDGSDWTADQLTRSIRAGLVRETGDTQIRVEDANITAAGDITLTAKTAVGELKTPYVIAGGASLSAQDLRMIAGADRVDIEIDTAANEIRIRQREDVNFGFTVVDTDGRAQGNLRVLTTDQEIFLGAETAADLASISSPGDVQIKIDGAMTDDGQGNWAVRGQAIVLESGNSASIGKDGEPVRIEVLPGGHLTARSGQNVFIAAPLGILPVSSVFAGGRASLTASGGMTDVVLSDLPRIVAADIHLDAASIGAAGQWLGVKLTDPATGQLTLVTRSGDAYMKAHSDLPLKQATLFAGGEIVANAAMSLTGADTIKFGTGSQLDLVLAQGLVTDASSGTDVSGGSLVLRTNGAVGAAAKRLETAISTLSLTGGGSVAAPLYANETDDLRIESMVQNAHAGSLIDIVAGGDISVGSISSSALVMLDGSAILDGRIIAERTVLNAIGAIGSASRLDVTTTRFKANTADGNADILLRDRAVGVEEILVGGSGALTLESTNAPVALLAGNGISTQGGTMHMRLSSLAAQANILSNGGAIDLVTTGNLTQTAGTRLDAESGTVLVGVDGDMTVATLRSTNGGNAALDLRVDGALSAVSGGAFANLEANTDGALTTLRLGSLTPVGPVGLTSRIARLDSVVANGAMHLNEKDALILENVIAQSGAIDIFTGGYTLVKTVRTQGVTAAPIVISALGDIAGDAAVISGGDVRLFAFGGSLTGETGQFFVGETDSGVTTYFYAVNDLHYRETTGDLRTGFALAETGNLRLETPDGSLTAGILGARGDITVVTANDLSINVIGRSMVDLADEVALQLVRPAYYGRKTATSPATVSLIAQAPGASLFLGLGTLKDTANLRADNIDARLADHTPGNALYLNIDDPAGGFAETVDVGVLADGPTLFFADPFADVRPRVAGRTWGNGTLLLDYARIGTGQVTHAGPEFKGTDVTIDGDVWFRQRSFDLLAQVVFDELSTVADAQVLAINSGEMGFSISNQIILTTDNVLVLNRRLAGVDLNGGQGFAFAVGVETGILGSSFVRSIGAAGITRFMFEDQFEDEIEVLDDETIILPLIMASAQPTGGLLR